MLKLNPVCPLNELDLPSAHILFCLLLPRRYCCCVLWTYNRRQIDTLHSVQLLLR